jgi:hypothetical protein
MVGTDMKALTIRAMLTLLLILASPGLGNDGISVFEPVRTRSHSREVRSGQVEYSLNAGGMVDMDNTTTRLYETFKIAFQNNVSLTMALVHESIPVLTANNPFNTL